MESGKGFLIRSLGYGVLVVSSSDEGGDPLTLPEVRSAVEQVGHVLELWLGPAGFYVAVTDGGHSTSKYEAAVVSDQELAEAVRSAARQSHLGSALRSRLGLVDAACAAILKEEYGTPLRP